MKRTSKKPVNKRRSKTSKKSRGKHRAANFAGALVLEVIGMVLLLTLFFTFRESPDEYNARMEFESNQPQTEAVRDNDNFEYFESNRQETSGPESSEFESYVVGLFEQKHNRR